MTLPMTLRLVLPVLITAYAAVLPAACSTPAVNDDGELVVLVHGLGRTSRSMGALERGLHEAGYRVASSDYPSTEETFEALATRLGRRLETLAAAGERPIHVVTHSMGGLLVRQVFADGAPAYVGRVVMLAPPNQGSELVDEFGEWKLFQWAVGDAGTVLGTGPEGVAARLGPVDYEVGVIAGDATVNPFSSSVIPGDDDGKVSVQRVRVEGMADFLVVPHSHTFIMSREPVIEQVVHFLRMGAFDHGSGGVVVESAAGDSRQGPARER